MARFTTQNLRNVGLISHGGAGKTSLAEAMLFDAGVTKRLGEVDVGNTVFDFDPEEIERKITINASIAPCPWKDVKINLIDCPGYFDFLGEVRAALRVADAAVVVVEAVSGVEVGTEMVWRYANEYELPRLVFVNKMDRENADFDRVLGMLQESFGRSVVPLQVPIGREEGFRGVVDLLTRKALIFEGDGRQVAEEGVPAELAEVVEDLRQTLIESVAETNDDLLMQYLEGKEPDESELLAALGAAVREQALVPVLCGAATRNIGMQPLLDVMVNYLPSPAQVEGAKGVNPQTRAEEVRDPDPEGPFAALVFKTLADPYVGKLTLFRIYSGKTKSDADFFNASKGSSERYGQLFLLKGRDQEPVDEAMAGDIVAVAKLNVTTTGDTLCDKGRPIVLSPITFPNPVYSVAVSPKAKGDEEKIGSGLARLVEEDPTFTVARNAETKQAILSGMGELHLDVITERLKRKFGVDVFLDTPRVPYRETVRKKVQTQYRHKKQSGGRGQYGEVYLELEPTERGGEFEFVDKIFGGAVPRQYIPAVEKGVRETLSEGVLAGYPVTDVRVTLYDGTYHSVDSSEMAFKIAASQAFKKGFLEANPVLLEPIVKVEVLVPEEFMGDVMGDLNKKRGRILGMEPQGATQVIRALVPQAEMVKYAIDLRSMTQGRGTFTMEFSHYEEMPAQVAESVIEATKAARAE